MPLVVTWTCNIFIKLRGIPEFPEQFSAISVDSDYGFGHYSNDLPQSLVFEDNWRAITGFLMDACAYPDSITCFRIESGHADVFSARRADHLSLINEQ